jgi:hypothetical protein
MVQELMLNSVVSKWIVDICPHEDSLSRSDPSERVSNRAARTVVIGLHMFEERQDVLRAIRRPNSQKATIGILEGTTAPHGNKSRASDLVMCLPF